MKQEAWFLVVVLSSEILSLSSFLATHVNVAGTLVPASAARRFELRRVRVSRACAPRGFSRARYAQVLGRLGLAGARRPRGRAAEDQVARLRRGDVDAVGERRDHEAAGVAEVLPGATSGGYFTISGTRIPPS